MKNIHNLIGAAVAKLAAVTLTLVSFTLASACFTALADTSYIPVQGLYLNGASNNVVIGGTNFEADVVNAASTNFYNLSITPQDQTDTNRFPAVVIQGNKSGPPFSLIGVQNQFSMIGSNGAAVLFRWYGSVDGSHWITNAISQSFTTNGTGGVYSIGSTNVGGIPFWCLGAIENSGPGKGSNLLFQVAGKPNL
jgi:hypothetical protein